MTRKDFLISVAGVAGLAAIAACGGSDEGGDDDGMNDMCTMPNAGSISPDHGHTVSVSIADVNAAVDKTYMLSNVGHTHMMTITAAQFAMLANQQAVTVTTTMGGSPGHTHTVTVTCTS
ncbi:MAG: hypothetical protein AB7L28_24450 [Kofleriaceae bacterium]